MKGKDWLILAAIGAGFYFLSRAFKVGEKTLAALNSAGSAIGSGLFSLFHPDPVGESLYYTVTFPTGDRHAIPSRSVDKNGQFSYIQPPLAATRWQMLISKDDNRRYAAPVK